MSRSASRLLTILLGLPLALALQGCSFAPSAILIGFDVDLQVASVGPAGVLWSARPDEISKTTPKPIELDRFGDTVYLGPLFAAGLIATKGGIGVSLTNMSRGEICFRFDEAALSSNFQSTRVAVRSWPPVNSDEERRMGWSNYWEKRRATGRLPLTKACLNPGEKRTVHGVSVAEMKEIFPSGLMFNVTHPEHVPELNQTGIGNWVKLHLPIDIAGRRENIEFTLTAKQSSARATYY